MRKKPTKAEIALFAVPAGVLLLMTLLGKNSQLSRQIRPLFAIFQRGARTRRDSCQSNLKNIHLAVLMYIQDYDERYPINSIGSYGGWAAIVFPYTIHNEYFQCPALLSNRPLTITDYWMNTNVFGVKNSGIVHPGQTLMLGDGNPGSQPNYALDAFPKEWPDDSDSPMNRHLDGANYLFLDGHAKWFSPDEIMKFGGKRGPFALR